MNKSCRTLVVSVLVAAVMLSQRRSCRRAGLQPRHRRRLCLERRHLQRPNCCACAASE